MKRFIVLLGIVLTLAGVRLYDCGVYRFAREGKLTIYSGEDCPAVFLPVGSDCYRIDLDGRFDVEKFLADCGAKIAFTEMDGMLIYAYSPLITRTEWVHFKRVNMMIAVSDETVSVGVPLLKGCY